MGKLSGKFGILQQTVARLCDSLYKTNFLWNQKELKILCLGAHPDDIEIGCGGTILTILKHNLEPHFHWVVFSGDITRACEAKASADSFLEHAASKQVEIHNFPGSYFPSAWTKIKDCFEELKKKVDPDIIFTHFRGDLHQDHSILSNLTWNTFRNNLILEYEIPKFDADLATPNIYVNLDDTIATKKIDYIFQHFKSQKNRVWFDRELFMSILRLRGVECNSKGYAEGFHARKLVL